MFVPEKYLAWAGRVSWQRILFFCVAANLPVWIALRAVGMTWLGWFDLDYLVVGILSLYLPPVASAALLAIAIAVDALAIVCQTYFLLPSEALKNLSAIVQMPGHQIVAALQMALMIALVAGASFFFRRPAKGRMATAAAFVVLGIVLGGVNRWQLHEQSGRWLSGHKDTMNLTVNRETRVVRIQAKWLISAEVYRWYWPSSPAAARVHADEASATDAGFDVVRTGWSENASPDLVLIVVESWGEANDSALRDALVNAYAQDANAYRIIEGTVPFNGPTVSGEMRELCDSDAAFRIQDAPESELANCLPRRLSAMGYQTTAVHGMTGHLFRRDEWYPKLGFQEILFRNELESQGLPDCPGAFRGTCDAAIANWIGKRLEEPSDHPRFTYWMTLNSHLPVPSSLTVPSPASCSVVQSARDQTALCNWYRTVENVHRSVAEIAAHKLARPTVFVLVGDHAPPFQDPSARDAFAPGVVPFLVLAPKSMDQPNASSAQLRSVSQKMP